MAVIEPYSPCPCGSGQKFKWCCHKVEAYADRSQRLFEGGQIEAALHALDEGLLKEKGNAWLLTRKALLLIRQGHPNEAKECLRAVVASQPKHFGALALLTRLVTETEGPLSGAAQFQQALGVIPEADLPKLGSVARMIASFFVETGDYPAALKHLRLAGTLGGADDEKSSPDRMIRSLLTDPMVSVWLKNEDRLSPAPEGATGPGASRFAEALGWAERGLWASAASAFETLTDDPEVGALAERNLGLCRLWLADDTAAVGAMRRYVAAVGSTVEAVEIEALCQQLIPDNTRNAVEQVQLSWRVRDRAALAAALEADPGVAQEPPDEDEDDPEKGEFGPIDEFLLLDRPDVYAGNPVPDGGRGLKPSDIPRIVGRVLLDNESVVLETYDDGRLDGLVERLTTLAGTSVVPAHPRTTVMGKASALQMAIAWDWRLPEGTSAEEGLRLLREQGNHIITNVWPETPLSVLEGRTPLQAAADGDSEVSLRAAVAQFEASREPWREGFDFDAFRKRLGIGPEPEIDPETVDPRTIHLARLADIPAERLSDEKLANLYRRAHDTYAPEVIRTSARLLTERPGAIKEQRLLAITVYTDLATLASREGNLQESREWLRKGREAEPQETRAVTASQWDMIELRLRAAHEPPEEWVPELAAILDRYANDQYASQLMIGNLVDMGLVEVSPKPDGSGEILFDPRPLQAVLSRYGPRVTTPTGRLGVSAARPDIWTPGGPAGGGSGGIWTPGSGSGGGESGEKKVIFPGR